MPASAGNGLRKSAPSLRSDMSSRRLLLLDTWQRFELVERRRRRQRPLEGRRADTPRIVARDPFPHKGLDHAIEEDEDTEARNIRTVGRDHVPTMERVRIVDITARHARQDRKSTRL